MLRLWLVLVSLVWCAVTGFAHAADPALAREVLHMTNQYRLAHGLNALTMDAELSKTALQHSQAMAQHRVPFGHQGFRQRMRHVYHVLDQVTAGSENVAYNYQSAQRVVDGWIKSRSHRKNLLGRYHLTGIGIERDAEGHLFYTQLFARMK